MNEINLTIKDLVLIGVAVSILAIILYSLLPVWVFMGMVVGGLGAANIFCVVLAGVHFFKPKQ